jgi:hypothetical protein
MGKFVELEEKIAKIICEARGYNPDSFEPGTEPIVDAISENGDPVHYLWREFTPLARKIIGIVKDSYLNG